MAKMDLAERQRAHLEAVTAWAAKLRAVLQPLLEAHGDRVHFRPTSKGVTMVGLLHERPQRGLGGLRDLARVVTNFETLFATHCRDIEQGRPTSEKSLQSFLLRDAYAHGRRMACLNEVAAAAGSPTELLFVTDEIPLPLDGERIVCDLLALRRGEGGAQVPVVVELKTERQMARLLQQVEGYASLVDQHAASFERLYGALLGETVSFSGPCEKWIVWPTPAGGGPDARAAELAARRVRVVGFSPQGNEFVFRLG